MTTGRRGMTAHTKPLALLAWKWQTYCQWLTFRKVPGSLLRKTNISTLRTSIQIRSTSVLGTNPTSEKTRFFPKFTSCALPQNGIALHLGYVYDIYVYLKSYVQVTEVSVMLAQLLRCAEGHHRRSWIRPILLDRSGKVQYGTIGPIVNYLSRWRTHWLQYSN